MYRTFIIALASFAALACSNGNTMMCDGGTLSLDVTAPECLRAPNHKMVLFDMQKDLNVTVTGSCPKPTLSLVSVTSNQPDLGGGQGNVAPDVIYGQGAICLRSERQGTSMGDRTYTITLKATDGVNTIFKSVDVRVQHDSNQSACPLVDSDRIVTDDDPRCAE